MIRSLLACVALIAFTGAIPKAPFRISTFAVGKPARGLPADGKPIVVVAFASWCVGCIDEFPELMRDYARFKDRVRFIGVDYLDNPRAGAATIAKYKIPFEVVSESPDVDAPPPANPNEQTKTSSLHLQGITPKMLRTMKPFPQLPEPMKAALGNVIAYCAKHDDRDCIEYANAHNVIIGGASPSPVLASPVPAPAAAAQPLPLPHLFVIDANGIVRADVTGYTSGRDAIRASLAKVGIK